MYEIGDYVINRRGGVWKITDTRCDTSTGMPVEYSLFAHGNSDNVITLPVGGDEIVRKIADKDAFSEAIERIPYIRTIQAPNDKIRRELYDEAMSKYDEIEWIKVIKTVYLRRQQKKLLPYETAYSAAAQGYLHGEASVLFDMPASSVEAYITGMVH